MTYSVHECFLTLQGEGINIGRPAVFIRFAGCNLWSGRERHRERAICQFCDTEFVGVGGDGGGRFKTADALAGHARSRWRTAPGLTRSGDRPLAVCTGGEPLLQLDGVAIAALHEHGFEVAVETNGTCPAPATLDWVCVSPKAGASLVQRTGNELKLVYPQPGAEPERYAGLDFEHFLLQPMDNIERPANTRAAIEYCLAHPQWRLSVQSHKMLGIP